MSRFLIFLALALLALPTLAQQDQTSQTRLSGTNQIEVAASDGDGDGLVIVTVPRKGYWLIKGDWDPTWHPRYNNDCGHVEFRYNYAWLVSNKKKCSITMGVDAGKSIQLESSDKFKQFEVRYGETVELKFNKGCWESLQSDNVGMTVTPHRGLPSYLSLTTDYYGWCSTKQVAIRWHGVRGTGGSYNETYHGLDKFVHLLDQGDTATLHYRRVYKYK